MLVLLLLALQSAPAAQQHPIRGLRAGESIQSLARAAGGDEAGFVWMRFLDATSSQPLEGVRVEAWTESGAKPLQLETRVDDVRSAVDGSVRVHWRRGEVRGEKLRISKPGYESQQRSPEDAELLLLPAQALRGRVLDLALHPVEGATVRSRQSCAHAISASETRTAADGSFVLEDFPLSQDESAELEVFADGYLPRGELDAQLLRQQAADAAARGGQGCTILVAKATAWRVRLLDASGDPLAQRRVRTTERPVIARRTDADGVCTFPAPSVGGSLYVETCDEHPPLAFSIPMLPRLGLANVRALGADALERFGADGLSSVRVHFDLAPRGAEVIPVSIFSESGFVYSGEELEHRIPRGKARVVIGCMDGFYLREQEIEIGPAPLLLEERVGDHCDMLNIHEVDAPEDCLFLAQTAEEGCELTPRPRTLQGAWYVDLPVAGPWAIAKLSPDGAVRVGTLAADPTGPARVRLRFQEPDCLIVPAVDDPSLARVRVTWRAEAAPGRLVPSSGTVWPAHMSSFDLAQEPDFELPEGRLYYAQYAAAGAVPMHVYGRAGSQKEAPIALVPRARLTLEGDVARVTSWAGAVDAVEQRFVLGPAPGPLLVRLEHRDGTASLLSLVLAPGEQRTLVVE